MHRKHNCNHYNYVVKTEIQSLQAMETSVVKYLNERGIKPSLQRIAIMEYLFEHRTHPTVDMIFNDLNPKMPTLSKTTIYNTLKLFVEKGAVLKLDVDDKEAHYDGDTATPAHFYCLDCGKILDIFPDVIKTDNVPELDGLDIVETRVYFKGYCRECAEKRKMDKESAGSGVKEV